MSVRGKQSDAHEIDSNTDQCIHCHMYKNQIDQLSHECTRKREELVDKANAKKAGKRLKDYRDGK